MLATIIALAFARSATGLAIPTVFVDASVPPAAYSIVCIYGPGSGGAAIINSSALRAAALIVLNAYPGERPSFPSGVNV